MKKIQQGFIAHQRGAFINKLKELEYRNKSISQTYNQIFMELKKSVTFCFQQRNILKEEKSQLFFLKKKVKLFL